MPRPVTKKQIPASAMQRESGLWKQVREGLKKTKRQILPTRLETWALPGVPDVLFCDEKGNFHLVELKFCNGNKVGLRPHQVSFLTRHQHSSSWILVKHQKINSKDYRILLFKAEEAVNLVMEGLKGSTPVAEFQGPFVDWDSLFRVLAP